MYNLINIFSVGADLFHVNRETDRETERQTDRQTNVTKLMVTFCSYANMSKNCVFFQRCVGGYD
jgi:hypothetical protein